MSPDKKSTPSESPNTPADKSIAIGGDVVDSVVIAGDNNVVNRQTIFQKIINFILPTESESMEQRNRRILLNHVENAWIKGVLDAFYNLLPWRLVPFLDHCVDLIFLRRVGGGYIFVHRLLMEHLAEMYVEIPTSKGNQK